MEAAANANHSESEVNPRSAGQQKIHIFATRVVDVRLRLMRLCVECFNSLIMQAYILSVQGGKENILVNYL